MPLVSRSKQSLCRLGVAGVCDIENSGRGVEDASGIGPDADAPRRPFSVLRQVALYGTGCGGLAFGAERLTIGAHPIHRLRTPQAALLEAWQDVAREQFIGALGRLPIGPIMREHQDAPMPEGQARTRGISLAQRSRIGRVSAPLAARRRALHPAAP